MTQKISFYAFAIYVIDLDESMLYYKRLGYENTEISDNEEYKYALMQIPGGNGACIELRESFTMRDDAGKTATVFTIDVDSELDDSQRRRLIGETIEDLMFRGFSFLNMTPKEFYIGEYRDSIEMIDPQGARIEFLLRA